MGRKSYKWECVRCGSKGGSDIADGTGAWEGAQLMLSLHRAVSPDCDGGMHTIRVTGAALKRTVATRRKAQRVSKS